MKPLLTILTVLLLFSCSKDKNITLINQTSINGEIIDIDTVYYIKAVDIEYALITLKDYPSKQIVVLTKSGFDWNKKTQLQGCNDTLSNSHLTKVTFYDTDLKLCKSVSGQMETNLESINDGFKFFNIYQLNIKDTVNNTPYNYNFEIRYSR